MANDYPDDYTDESDPQSDGGELTFRGNPPAVDPNLWNQAGEADEEEGGAKAAQDSRVIVPKGYRKIYLYRGMEQEPFYTMVEKVNSVIQLYAAIAVENPEVYNDVLYQELITGDEERYFSSGLMAQVEPSFERGGMIHRYCLVAPLGRL